VKIQEVKVMDQVAIRENEAHHYYSVIQCIQLLDSHVFTLRQLSYYLTFFSILYIVSAVAVCKLSNKQMID